MWPNVATNQLTYAYIETNNSRNIQNDYKFDGTFTFSVLGTRKSLEGADS